MRLVPITHHGKIQYFQNKEIPWGDHAAQIGTSPAAVADLAAKVAAAREKLAAQAQAAQAARSATADLRAAIRDMAQAGADIIKQIRAKAAADGGDDVYVLAQIPAPATPSPIPPPGTPANFTVTLRGDGSLMLKWKCKNPRGAVGTIYQISRQIGAGGEFTNIGVVGSKRFVDTTLSAGAAASVTYQVVAMRSTAAGTAARFTVNLGVQGAAGAAASVLQVGVRRLAA
jgi:hypothetical protein